MAREQVGGGGAGGLPGLVPESGFPAGGLQVAGEVENGVTGRLPGVVGAPGVFQIAGEHNQIDTAGGLASPVFGRLGACHQLHGRLSGLKALHGECLLVEAHRIGGVRVFGSGFQVAWGIAWRVRLTDRFLEPCGALGDPDQERRAGAGNMLVADPQAVVPLFRQMDRAAGLARFLCGNQRDPFPGQGMEGPGIHQKITLPHADGFEALREEHLLRLEHHARGLPVGRGFFRQAELAVSLCFK